MIYYLLKLYVWFQNTNINCHKTDTLSLNLYKNTLSNVRFFNYLFHINTKWQHCSFEQQSILHNRYIFKLCLIIYGLLAKRDLYIVPHLL